MTVAANYFKLFIPYSISRATISVFLDKGRDEGIQRGLLNLHNHAGTRFVIT